jgi:hypothetical protein
MQRNVTKRLAGLRGVDYKSRLLLLNLESLETRRLWFVCLQDCFWRIRHRLFKTVLVALVMLLEAIVTHCSCIVLGLTSCLIFFCNHVVNVWNYLPANDDNFVSQRI